MGVNSSQVAKYAIVPIYPRGSYKLGIIDWETRKTAPVGSKSGFTNSGK